MSDGSGRGVAVMPSAAAVEQGSGLQTREERAHGRGRRRQVRCAPSGLQLKSCFVFFRFLFSVYFHEAVDDVAVEEVCWLDGKDGRQRLPTMFGE